MPKPQSPYRDKIGAELRLVSHVEFGILRRPLDGRQFENCGFSFNSSSAVPLTPPPSHCLSVSGAAVVIKADSESESPQV